MDCKFFIDFSNKQLLRAEDQSVDKIIRRADFIWDQNKQLTRED
ncbi:hypothetical protein CWATWH8502_170 [Crocosphaera watsonii WH 8502]|uniref:Uncharacterized protein n=4 Tax=Crocosphaera watsonii TaxID=263511 RepID=T2JMR9_CROWT|nr:hypothetical protein CWATWH0003_5081 [Crocosphaera watsonii WH 0003]CCQ51173.1 hypothetical protein CWATWH8502_170 [Crocosphaera watsonii WH 8502]CCQ54559.1 hypothetical protein CWATWH0005_1617 [Crocosphaera watsonii WH 0005]CCQ66555.1 hypothetical protein CWATWH0402_42 [Crocosphaera watsonii WH 0402]